MAFLVSAMGARENMLAVGLQSLVAFSPPVFSGATGKGPVDYFLDSGEYLGRGFSAAVDEAKNKSCETQLELFESAIGK